MFTFTTALLVSSLSFVSGQVDCSIRNYSNFTLSALLATGLAVPVNLHTDYTIIKRSGYVLASVAPERYHSFYLTGGTILADTPSPAWTWPDTLQTGGSLMWINQGYYPSGYQDFCFASTNNGLLLGAAGRTDEWSLCTNTSLIATPRNRVDVVWKADNGHSNYVLSDCQPVNLLVTPIRA